MPKQAKVLILRTAGTNCNEETAFAFAHFGAAVDQVHVNRLLKKQVRLSDYHILALPGGFSYGDDIAAGRILANKLRLHLREELKSFIEDGKLILGICNGFQVMIKAGLLPGTLKSNPEDVQPATLTNNDSGKFEDRWTCLKMTNDSVWTKGLPEIIYLPIAHGEGKFLTKDEQTLGELKQTSRIALRYCDPQGKKSKYPWNPNGSMEDIAGITDESGRVLGLMPHPERHFFFTQCPAWTRLEKKSEYGDGAKIFANGVEYVRRHLIN